jgi:hypothetical protein
VWLKHLSRKNKDRPSRRNYIPPIVIQIYVSKLIFETLIDDCEDHEAKAQMRQGVLQQNHDRKV